MVTPSPAAPSPPWPTATGPVGRRDLGLLAAARTIRGFGAGGLSIVLAVDLARAGYTLLQLGVLVGLAMAFASLWALAAPRLERRWARRRVLAVGALALAGGGLLLWADLADPAVVLVALALGGIVVGGSDISPLGALEQAGLAGLAHEHRRTPAFALYNFLGYLGGAAGALAAVPLSALAWGVPGLARSTGDATLLLYGSLGFVLLGLYAGLSPRVEGPRAPVGRHTLSTGGRPLVLRLAALFAVDAFGGGLIANVLVVSFLEDRFAPGVAALGSVIFLGNLAAAASLLLAVPMARRFGLLPTMVFTHIPSSLLLILFGLAFTFPMAAVLWVARSCLSQMDVPTRQSYTQAIVPVEDRTAAAGYTTAARSGQAVGGPVTGVFLNAAGPWLSAPFVLAGSVKIAYDLLLFRSFRHVHPPEERGRAGPGGQPP